MDAITNHKGVRIIRSIEFDSRVEELAYIAGLFDGEGCISMMGPHLIIIISNTFKESLEFVDRVFGILGGGICEMHPSKKVKLVHSNYKRRYDWRIRGKNAARILELLLPYLIIKKEQAILGIELELTSNIERKAKIYIELRDLKR
jgi:hypothetical protein